MVGSIGLLIDVLQDYSVFRAKIEAFDDHGYSKRIFGIENIFAVVN